MSFELEREYTIRLEEKSHTYYVNDEKVKWSPTKIVSAVFPKFNAKSASERYVLRHSTPYSPQDLRKRWAEKGAQARQIGHKFHCLIDHFFKSDGEIIDTGDIDLSAETRSFLDLVKQWAEDKIEIMGTEIQVYAEKVAGTIDALFKDSLGRYYLVDWKRSKGSTFTPNRTASYPFEQLKDTKISKWSVQMNIYAYLLSKHNIKVHKMMIIRFYEEELQVFDIPSLGESVIKLFSMIRSGLLQPLKS